MKFEEMVATSSTRNKSKINKNIIPVIVFFVVLISFFVIYYSFFVNKNEDKKTSIDISNLTSSDLLVQTLYSRVHDFNTKNPLWMYVGESGSLISNMTESTKMALVYANMKTSDLFDISCSDVPATISGYEDYKCNSTTKAIKIDNVNRVYKELFGKNTHVATSSIIKKDNLSSGIFVYITDLDLYVEYSKAATNSSSDASSYNFEITKISATSTEIKIYEKITKNNTTSSINYVYTFKQDDSNNYIYYSREKI